MQIRPLNPKLTRFIVKRGLTNKFNKQLGLFRDNPNHPALDTEKLAPNLAGLYSFRIDSKYRVIFHFLPDGEAQIVDINDHYQ